MAAWAGPVRSPTKAAPTANDSSPLIPFEAVNPPQPTGDGLGAVRRIAASIVAQDDPAPRSIVDIGSATGELLEAFMQRFPHASGQWTEGEDAAEAAARTRLDRFGGRVRYVIGCPLRTLSPSCLPGNVDVITTSWLTIHQDLAGVRRYYQAAAAALKPGGWVVDLDHVSQPDEGWRRRLEGARVEALHLGLVGAAEGPPIHHADYVVPTVAEQLDALDKAGFDAKVVWQRFDTVLLMGRRR